MPTETLHNEPQLIAEMQSGNQDAFTTLYRHYSPALYYNIRRLVYDPVVAEEIVQELFTRVWQKREYKGLKENFSGYIYTMARHLVHDFFRRLKKDSILLEKFRSLTEDTEDYTKVEDSIHQRQSSAIINHAIDKLPPQQKKVYRLVKQEGYTYKKAAESLGISPLTVKEYLTLANKAIRNYLLSNVESLREVIVIILLCAFL